jgi:hypothetical protein
MAKMKRIKSIQLLSLLLVFGLFSACEDDITFNGLPQPAQDLINQNYSSSTITRIEREYDEPYCYEVYLSNGVELYFDCDGVLLYTDYDCNDGTGIGEGLVDYQNLPQPIKDYLQQNHAGTKVCYTEKDCDPNDPYAYEVVLKDGFELYFDINTNFLFSEKDDDVNC